MAVVIVTRLPAILILETHVGAVFDLSYLGGPLGWVSALFSMGAAYTWAKMRGRHPAFGLAGLLFPPLGAFTVLLLKKRCVPCGAVNGRTAASCERCRSPL